MAAWRHAGSIEKFQQKMIDGMLANGYERDFAERCFQSDQGFWRIRLSRKPRRQLRAAGLRQRVDQAVSPAAFCCALLEQPADGILRSRRRL
jgi:error-prone DNA polymerase